MSVAFTRSVYSRSGWGSILSQICIHRTSELVYWMHSHLGPRMHDSTTGQIYWGGVRRPSNFLNGNCVPRCSLHSSESAVSDSSRSRYSFGNRRLHNEVLHPAASFTNTCKR